MIFGFLYSSEEIDRIQKAISKENLKWKAAENWVTKLPLKERRLLLGYSFDPAQAAYVQQVELSEVEDLPLKFDWRNNDGNWITPVKNQGQCGSCWDFSAVAQVEAWWKISNNSDDMLDLSEQFILSCGDNGGCNGDAIGTALDFIEMNGIPPETCLEYQASDTVPCISVGANYEDSLTFISGWGYITTDKAIVKNIKNAIYRHPVSASFDVYSDFYAYSGGVYEHLDTATYEGGHAILIVGWDDSERSWLCKNSWGTSWGESGYFRIKWGECNIGTYSPFIHEEIISTPSLVFSPKSVDLILTAGDSADVVFTVKNNGTGNLECSVIDNIVQNMFHIDDFQSYDGSSWWCGTSDIGGYNNSWLQYLLTPLLDLSGTTQPKLTWKGKWAVEDTSGAELPYDGWDGCNVWISTDGLNTYNIIEPLSPRYNCENLYSFSGPECWNLGSPIPGWGGNSNGWIDIEFDLSLYCEDSVVIAWAFASDQGQCTINDTSLTGFSVDGILIKDGSNLIYQNSADSIGGMHTVGYGGVTAQWIEINSDDLIITSGDSISVNVKILTADVEPGEYKIYLNFLSNDETVVDNVATINLIITPTVVPIRPSENDRAPSRFKLDQNYPNPFNPVTTFSYRLPEESTVDLSIFNFRGQLIQQLVTGRQEVGVHTIQWNAERFPSGIYFYRLKAGKNTQTRKCILLK